LYCKFRVDFELFREANALTSRPAARHPSCAPSAAACTMRSRAAGDHRAFARAAVLGRVAREEAGRDCKFCFAACADRGLVSAAGVHVLVVLHGAAVEKDLTVSCILPACEQRALSYASVARARARCKRAVAPPCPPSTHTGCELSQRRSPNKQTHTAVHSTNQS